MEKRRESEEGKNHKEEKEEVYLSWSSPSRLFKRRDKEYFTNIGAIVFLLVVIFIFAREFMLVIAVLALVFLIYVLSTVPPEEVTHRITNLGIESAGHFYRWDDLIEFWLEEQWGQNYMILKPYMGTRIIILLGNVEPMKARELVAKHIPFREEPEKSFADTAAKWLAAKIPLEKPTS